MKFSKYPKHSDSSAGFTEQEFDRFLNEVDDFAGEAPGLTVSPDFLPRVVEMARMESMTVRPSWSLRHWFSDLSLTMRLAATAAVLLACIGGIRAGQALTDVIAQRSRQPAIEHVDPLGLAIPERAIVQLMHNDGLTIHGQTNKSKGERQ